MNETPSSSGSVSNFDIRVLDLHPERLAYCRTRQRHLVRLGFALDADTQPGKLVFNRTITLKDTWATVKTSDSQSGKAARCG